ncbi:prepilin-type N-terminal cleavage/methylation domain-containing protein [Eubacterium multiforme]|uniref:Type IV pilus assembly protein PilA n=1 Tax=Eubacterium multiforme TaxID=83339 RepID=A0ABT9UNS2_9FIRM|nr:prepilin-type N-terminal cleavage/methylation domain-containing protein [Eubacterium multiforme]MDQ0148287.1 type IV pilus assembly protein PilA [Eubacterium multiforme]
MNKLMKKKKKGFTLIELIAVIAILAILAAIAVPRVIQYVDKSKRVAVQTEATTIYNAAEAAYNDGRLTGVTSETQFNAMTAKDAVTALTTGGNNLLSNADYTKVGGGTTLAKLKDIMNTNETNIVLDDSGNFSSLKTTNSGSH